MKENIESEIEKVEEYIKITDDVLDMKLKYFSIDPQNAVKYWNDHQFDLSDILTSMINAGMEEGMQLYNTFMNQNVLEFMKVAKFNYKLAKKNMGISGEYVERKENDLQNLTPPKFNSDAIVVSKEEFIQNAKLVYEQIIDELKTIGEYGINFMQKKIKK